MSIAIGLHPVLSFERYTSLERVNISHLKEMARSALHYHYRATNPRGDTKAMSFGRSVHTAILEPERFASEYVVWDQLTESGELRPRRGKAWDAFVSFNPGKTIIRLDEYNFACAVRDAVRAKPVAMKYLADGQPEVSMVWEDAATSTPCKGRLDWVTRIDGDDVIVGIKKTRDLDPRRFSQQAASLLYYLQWGFYHDGYFASAGRTPRVVEVVVEAEAPFDCVVYLIPPEVIDRGRDEYRALLERLGECQRADRWPGRAENEVIFELPAYLQDEGAESEEDPADLRDWKEG
jgi:exodeoxyribonuclease VIII